MRRIKEVLRLKEAGLSDKAVSRSAGIARSTVKEYLDRAAAAGLSWQTACELSEEALDARLFVAADTRRADRPMPDWEAVEQELRGDGVTLRLLWLEYLGRHPEGYRSSTVSTSMPGSDAPGHRRCAGGTAPARRSKSIGPAWPLPTSRVVRKN